MTDATGSVSECTSTELARRHGSAKRTLSTPATTSILTLLFFFSSRRRHTRYWRDWSSDVCSSDLDATAADGLEGTGDTISGLFTPPEADRSVFVFSSRSEGYFGVRLICADGGDLLQNESGAVQDNETIVRFGQAPCLWQVQADGDWSIRQK